MMAQSETKPSRARVSLTIDVERDYGRADSHSILDRAAPFFDWLYDEQLPLTAFVTGQLLEQGRASVEAVRRAKASSAVHGFTQAAATSGAMITSHEEDSRRGVEAYTQRVGRPPAGYRAPAGIVSREDVLLLDRLGLRY